MADQPPAILPTPPSNQPFCERVLAREGQVALVTEKANGLEDYGFSSQRR